MMDSSARLAAYRKQNGRESLTPRQYKQWERMETLQIRALRRIRERLGAVVSGRPTDTTTEGT